GVASHRKRVLALPFVLRAVRHALPDARLRLAGFAWQDAPELAALCEELGVRDAVECIGAVPPEAMPRIYRAAQLLVVPSAYEGLPYVIVEALREGTAVVATRVSGHPEVLDDGVTGRLVPPDDPRALAQACVALLRDPEARARLGQAGRRRVAEQFDPERQIDAYLDYYLALASGVGDPPTRIADAGGET
ncbi:MAG: glycosyltransferase family 4 protein, partial [Myxococcota bacterium]